MYLDAEEAASSLGVSVATLYAYVSRKKIRSQAVPGTKKRRYWKDDILGLHSETAPPSSDVLTATTQITLINEAGPFYRGQSAIRLAEAATIEEVAGLLWDADPAEAFSPRPFVGTLSYTRILQALEGATPTERVMTLLPVLERGNPRAYDLSRTGTVRNAAEIMRWIAGIIVGRPGPTAQPLHAFLAESLGKPAVYADLIRRLLVLAADHELDPTTYAVRAVANTGATAYQIAIAGIATSTGRRLIFGRAQSLSRLLDELAASSDPAEPIMRRLREGEAIPGFTSSLYKSGDPTCGVATGCHQGRVEEGHRDVSPVGGHSGSGRCDGSSSRFRAGRDVPDAKARSCVLRRPPFPPRPSGRVDRPCDGAVPRPPPHPAAGALHRGAARGERQTRRTIT